MTTILERNEISAVQLSSNADEVTARMIIPSDCVLLTVKGDIHGVMTTAQVIDAATFIGMDGFVLPVEDSDTAQTYDNLWDTNVIKDMPVLGAELELDDESAKTPPYFNTGEPNIGEVMNMDLHSHHFWKYRNMVTLASRPIGTDPSTAEENYIPTFKTGINRNVSARAQVNSVALLGVSVPETVGEDTSMGSTPAAESEWAQIKYVDMVLEQAMVFLLGLHEPAGSEPFEEASNKLLEFLEPPVVEQSSTTIIAGGWNIFSVVEWRLQVPGRLAKQVISAG